MRQTSKLDSQLLGNRFGKSELALNQWLLWTAEPVAPEVVERNSTAIRIDLLLDWPSFLGRREMSALPPVWLPNPPEHFRLEPDDLHEPVLTDQGLLSHLESDTQWRPCRLEPLSAAGLVDLLPLYQPQRL